MVVTMHSDSVPAPILSPEWLGRRCVVGNGQVTVRGHSGQLGPATKRSVVMTFLVARGKRPDSEPLCCH
jgi:hypothetical protein